MKTIVLVVLSGFMVSIYGCTINSPEQGLDIVYPTPYEHPAISVNSMLAYRDNGILSVNTDGTYNIDNSYQGIWCKDINADVIKQLSRGGDYPAWSHNGDKLSYSDGSEIFVIDVSGRVLNRIHTDLQCGSMSWGVNGDKIYFEARGDEYFGYHVWCYDIVMQSKYDLTYGDTLSYRHPVVRDAEYIFCIKYDGAGHDDNISDICMIQLGSHNQEMMYLSNGEDIDLSVCDNGIVYYTTYGEHRSYINEYNINTGVIVGHRELWGSQVNVNNECTHIYYLKYSNNSDTMSSGLVVAVDVQTMIESVVLAPRYAK